MYTIVAVAYGFSSYHLKKYAVVLMTTVLFSIPSLLLGQNQNLKLPEAIETGINNYGDLRAKNNYALAAEERADEVVRRYLPDIGLAAQQSYGTTNGQYGPLFGINGFAGSSGPYQETQNWNAAFGSLYFVNVNWEIFSFGRRKRNIKAANAEAEQFGEDYAQEVFQHKIKIASAYLNLLASQRLLISQEKNLERAEVFFQNVSVRAKNGLMPGVDSSMAGADVSRARITLNQVKEQVKTQNNTLAEFMGVRPQNFVADSTFLQTIPSSLIKNVSDIESTEGHPAIRYMESRIFTSEQIQKAVKAEYFPSITALGVYQARGSGINPDYASDLSSYSNSYSDGINPTRQNYLIGVGFVWNLTNISEASKRFSSQKLITEGLKEENNRLSIELENRNDAADARIAYALNSYNEAPKQVEAAQAAYRQRLALYDNGLTTLTDVTTALYALNRAETDRDIAYTNVWQALLLKASAAGDINIFLNEFK